jgi:hypothetical protein
MYEMPRKRKIMSEREVFTAQLKAVVIVSSAYLFAGNGLYKLYLIFTEGVSGYLLLELFLCYLGVRVIDRYVNTTREAANLIDILGNVKESEEK